MPFAKLTMTPAPTPGQAEILTTELTDLIAGDLGKRHDLTSVLIETPDVLRWTIGAGQRPAAAHLEVCVTAGTNSEQDKRLFIADAMTMLRNALPALDPATYVVITEIAGSDWGFDGKTQADRARLSA